MSAFVPDPFMSGTVTVGGGRGLAYSQYGDADGVPVLFVPGAASGAAMAFGAGELAIRGIRLISVDRPGLGASDPDPGKTFRSVADDLAVLVEEVAGEAVPVVANSQGAPFGIASALSGIATRLMLVSPADEVAFPPITAQLPEDFRSLVGAVGQSPPREALEMFASFTPASFFDMLMAAPTGADAVVYADERFRSRFAQVLEAGFAQGSDGYARDTVLAMSSWGLDLTGIRVPVSILFGAEDATHSPDQGATLAARIPNAERTIVPDAGGALLWAHPALVLEQCVR